MLHAGLGIAVHFRALNDRNAGLRTPFFALIALLPLLAACETSARLQPLGNPFGGSDRLSGASQPPPRIDTAPSVPVQSMPLPPVARQDLAPPPGVATVPPAGDPLAGAASGTMTPDAGGAATTPVTPPQVAVANPPKVPAAEEPTARPTQSSVTGSWTARDAAGGSCRVTLSSTPKLDLYNASAAGCASKDLQRVTAWELRGDDVYLYEPGGGVAARLKASGRTLSGALSKSGAPLTLSK